MKIQTFTSQWQDQKGVDSMNENEKILNALQLLSKKLDALAELTVFTTSFTSKQYLPARIIHDEIQEILKKM